MTHYRLELERLALTYKQAIQADIKDLKTAIAAASESSVIGIGSGGSYTVASLLCNLHETYTGRVSRASTPLEIICNPTLASASPVFLVSAEGKNPDIIEALTRAKKHSSRTIHVITNRETSALSETASALYDVKRHVFELDKKDGYLATNSLLMDAILVARAYMELDGGGARLPSKIEELKIGGQSVESWVQGISTFTTDAVEKGAIILAFSPLLRPIAADLESKLAESALLHCQLADIRSFAHGRHLWLAERPKDCAILAITEPSLEGLWDHMASLFPEDSSSTCMRLSGSSPGDLIAGLVAAMYFVGALAERLQKDPGKPSVPQFGKDIYYTKIDQLVARPESLSGHGEINKSDVFGARWPYASREALISRALKSYEQEIQGQTFRAIVFDYDGTLCSSQKLDTPPSAEVAAHLTRLVEAGVVVGIASGRGDSLQDRLRQALPESTWSSVKLGLYNGGLITTVAEDIEPAEVNSEFLSHVVRIVRGLQRLGAPIEKIRPTPPYQVSIRFKEGAATDQMWFVVADALRTAGLDVSRIVKSKHSIDVLESGVSKSLLVANIIQAHAIDPYQILTFGDQGAWPGNDSGLLEHKFSLSVDTPSRRMDRGWKFAPRHLRDVDATLWYMSRISCESGGIKVKLRDN